MPDCYNEHKGPVAHLGERLTCTEEVAGSSPVGSTFQTAHPGEPFENIQQLGKVKI